MSIAYYLNTRKAYARHGLVHVLAAIVCNLAAILHDPSGVHRQHSVQRHTFTDAQALADGIHGMAVGV